MSISYYELSDGRQLGIDAFEIISLPSATVSGKSSVENCEIMAKEFKLLWEEFYKLVSDGTCLELLWVTEKAVNQTFTSRIRIFVVLRKLTNDRNLIDYEITNLKKNLILSFSSMQYGTSDDEGVYDSLKELLSQVNHESVFGIAKSEKCTGSASSLYPYYYTDVLPTHNANNFNGIVSAMSQQKNCCISFQLFPTHWTPQETYMINEVTGELGRIVAGTAINRELYRDAMAEAPLKTYTYYNERRNAPVFSYNILTFGERACCASMATKIISLLQSGDGKIAMAQPLCIDLSAEGIDLTRQFPHYPWNVNTRMIYYYRNKNLQATIPLARNLFRLPYLITAEEATGFFRLPLHEKSMSALKSNQILQAREQFSKAVVDERNIQIGKLITNDATQITIGCPQKSFTKHALVVGTPGSGKTTFSVNLLLQFARKGIPFLAIEPTKSEYRAMIEAIPELRIFTPGNNAVAPYIINPFIPPKGIRVEQYIPSLTSAFKAAFSMPSPLDMIFLKAVRACYIQYGWKDYSKAGDPDVQHFGLYEFIKVFRKLIDNTNYSKEVRGNIESAGLIRLTNLIEQNSNIYDTINTVPIEDLLNAPTVLELNSIDNAEQKSLIIALLLINVCVYTKHNHVGDGELKNAILIDEAHVLLGGSAAGSGEGADSQGTTIKALQDMIAEIRSYGTSIIIADQSPAKVSREVVANTDIKVAFRLVQSVEKDLIADSTNMDETAKANLSRLKPGEAYVYYSLLEEPQMVVTEDIREKEGIRLSVSDEEVAARSTYWNKHQELLRPYSECQLCDKCQKTCDFRVRSNAEYVANQAFERYRKAINTDTDFRKCIYQLPNLMRQTFDQYKDLDLERLQICTRIKLLRKVELDLPVKLTKAEMEKVIRTFPEKKA